MTAQLTDRQHELLLTIIEEYISTAQPVGSKLVAEKYLPDVSPATVRNDMAVLEDQGYVCQPHTSAGRVPTAKAYELYVAQLDQESVLSDHIYRILKDIAQGSDERARLKNLAKAVIEETGESAVIGFSAEDTFYTGISNLFTKPEFSNMQMVVDMSRLIDHLDRIVKQLMDNTSKQVDILIGQQCQLSDYCSMIVAPLTLSSGNGMFGLFGLTRMDYKKNRDIVKGVADIINKGI